LDLGSSNRFGHGPQLTVKAPKKAPATSLDVAEAIRYGQRP
jgi:hypothetical protein